MSKQTLLKKTDTRQKEKVANHNQVKLAKKRLLKKERKKMFFHKYSTH